MSFNNQNTKQKAILITGGAGFIGSHVVRLYVNKYPDLIIINLDALTYAGNLNNLKDIEHKENYRFVKGDICNALLIQELFATYDIVGVIHLAAESHVDRSILGPLECAMTNVMGTVNLLNAAYHAWKGSKQKRLFYHVSTDEVYGSLGDEGQFREETPYNPHSPYSASKASADHFVRAFHDTFDLPIIISNCSNNYGTHQFPEKLIPLTIYNTLHGIPIPIYGNGLQIRDWLSVEDHARAIDHIFHNGTVGETYNIGCNAEWKNIDLVKFICTILDQALDRPDGTSAQGITFVKDRPGHDVRYALNTTKLQSLGWAPLIGMDQGIPDTVAWYLSNQPWLDNVVSGEYKSYYQKQYTER